MAPVLRDLRTTGVDSPRIDADDWVGEPEAVSAMLMAPDGSGMGVSTLRADTPVERVVSMAGQVQKSGPGRFCGVRELRPTGRYVPDTRPLIP